MSADEADSVRIAKLEQSVAGLSSRMDGFTAQLNDLPGVLYFPDVSLPKPGAMR